MSLQTGDVLRSVGGEVPDRARGVPEERSVAQW